MSLFGAVKECFGRLCVYRFSVYAMLALRLCQGIAALISFWIMAAAPANAVKDLYEFRLLTTVGVMIFIWSVLQVLYRGGKEFGVPIPDRREAIKLLEAVLELVLLILTFSAAVASAYRLNADNTYLGAFGPLSLQDSDEANRLTAAVTFMFFTWLFTCVTFYGQFVDWRMDFIAGPGADYEDFTASADPYAGNAGNTVSP